MTDLIALLNHAQAEADDLMAENERLKRTLERLDATKDEIERAETIVTLRTELQRQKAQNDLLLSLLKQAQTQNVAHGLAQRSRALRLLGNGVVPLEAAYAWRSLSAALGLGWVDLGAYSGDDADNANGV